MSNTIADDFRGALRAFLEKHNPHMSPEEIAVHLEALSPVASAPVAPASLRSDRVQHVAAVSDSGEAAVYELTPTGFYIFPCVDCEHPLTAPANEIGCCPHCYAWNESPEVEPTC